ncbi:MAG: propionate catabolism operon regulatory protein PrpR [Moraxellaceae bacterium]|nr:propionate catabolism operon regulatory protein PrpR [Moraxellaceae bacterium]MDZ4387209.1 propionate catabolism operon regulatory protein PrpR [Moraxellaceae bacterium]
MKPLLVVVATRYLAEQIRAIVPAYSAVADFRIVDAALDEAVETLQALASASRPFAVVAAGASAKTLRTTISQPVVQIRVGGFDIMQALIQARRFGQRIVIVTRVGLGDEFSAMRPVLNLSLEQRPYHNHQDAELILKELSVQSGVVIVGSSQIVHLANQYGLPGVLIYSETAIRQAIDDAMERLEITRVEAAKRDQLTQVLASLNEGVIAVDAQEQVLAMNPAAEQLIGVVADWAKGRALSSLAASLSLANVLADGVVRRDEVVAYKGRNLVINRLPLLEGDKTTGALLTFQEASRIDEAGRRLRRANVNKQFQARWLIDDIVGESDVMKWVKSLAQRFAESDSGVLIQGESGTGKELFAQGIHRASARKAFPFVALNCAALPENLLESELFGYEEGAFTGSRRGGKPGLIELADKGTLFLDEIGDMPISLQTRLLRVLQEREVIRLGSTEPTPVNIRVIAATHVDLDQAVVQGQFRADLYYRLNILRLQLPALRERGSDMALLAEQLLRRELTRHGMSAPLAPLLVWILQHSEDYDWPGNVRELENLCERVVVCYAMEPTLNSPLLFAMLPEFGRSAEHAATKLEGTENLSIEQVISDCQGDLTEAAKVLGISRTTLWRRRRKQ